MGSYNVSCSISGLSIHCGDEVVYFPLEKTKYPNHIIGDSNNSLIYPWCIYSPITLPIYGDYGDYGTVDIQEDEHTKFLEDKLGYKLEDLIERCQTDDPPPCSKSDGFDLNRVGSGMFILREIYEMMTNFCIDDCGRIHNYREQLEKEYQIFLDEVERHKKIYGNDFTYLRVSHSSFELSHHKSMKEIYFDSILTKQFKEEFIRFRIFEWGMFVINKFYFPAMNGCQFGCTPAEKILLEKSLELVNKRLKKENKEDDNDNLNEHTLLRMVRGINNFYNTLYIRWIKKWIG